MEAQACRRLLLCLWQARGLYPIEITHRPGQLPVQASFLQPEKEAFGTLLRQSLSVLPFIPFVLPACAHPSLCTSGP